jgi:hypothetical protein
MAAQHIQAADPVNAGLLRRKSGFPLRPALYQSGYH